MKRTPSLELTSKALSWRSLRGLAVCVGSCLVLSLSVPAALAQDAAPSDESAGQNGDGQSQSAPDGSQGAGAGEQSEREMRRRFWRGRPRGPGCPYRDRKLELIV